MHFSSTGHLPTSSSKKSPRTQPLQHTYVNNVVVEQQEPVQALYTPIWAKAVVHLPEEQGAYGKASVKAALQHEGPRTESCELEPTTRRHQSPPRHRSSSPRKEPHRWDEERAPGAPPALGWDSAGVAPVPAAQTRGKA